MGKGWARGLTKETDSRVYRAAQGHRGLTYHHHLPAEDRKSRYPRVRIPNTEDDWTPELAYAVGLIATDGCLSGDRRHVSQVSEDRDLLETFKACVGSRAAIGVDRDSYRVQIADVGFYRWLETIGLTQRKSLTLGAISVPDPLFFDFTRGLLDGDGSVIVSHIVPDPRRYPEHRYERLRVQFHSASEEHIRWLSEQLARLLRLNGWIGVRVKSGHHPFFILRYSKHDSIRLLDRLYRDAASPRLERKWKTWVEF